MKLTYKIPFPTDKKGGYLSAANTSHPFTLDGKIWPSVEHYMLAKRFEGSTLEGIVHKAKTVYIARHLANPRYTLITSGESGETLKRVIKYGKDRSVDIRPDWTSQDGHVLYRATLAKFEQHPKIKKMLIATEGIELVGIVALYDYGKILSQIRYEFLNPKKPLTRSLTMPRPSEDIPGDRTLTDREINILKRIKKCMKKMASTTSSTDADVEITEDAIYNVLSGSEENSGPDKRLEVLKGIRKWIDNLTWTEVVEKMPKFEVLTRFILNDISYVAPSNRIKVSLTIASVFRWARVVYPSKIFQREKREKIYLPPIRRSYRSQPPKRLFVKGSSLATERGSMYIKTFIGYSRDEFSKLVAHFENLPLSERLLTLEKFSKATEEERKVLVPNIIT